MQEERKISLCIPNFNRVDMVLEAFEKVYNDERISEIIISDDHSDRATYYELESLIKFLPKVKMFRNEVNVDCHRNKRISIELATNDWCVLLDSDNIINTDYLDNLFTRKWFDDIIYTPSFASPHFDFRAFEKLTVVKYNVAKWIDEPMFETMLNACNYFVNRKEYLKTWPGSKDPVTSDSIFFCLNWLERGNKIWVVPGQTYEHRVHPGSHYQNNVARTPNGFHQEILHKLRELK